ncbi:MAG: hypothetical protein R6W68_06805 [Ignavibacteriaceae bacterium]
MNLSQKVNQILNTFNWFKKIDMHFEYQTILAAQYLIELNKNKKVINSLRDVEFKVFSQWGDDGIIQWLIHNLDIKENTFIEFGVENYSESNTRFLLMNNNWSGLVMDGSSKKVKQIKNSYYYWKHDITAIAAFIDSDNINMLISSGFSDEKLGLLHIDIDGNDYWIWKTIDVVDPDIVIVEYNSVFGIERPITIPYHKNFVRSVAHPSCLYYGTSLKALHILASEKGYAFIGCNSAGNNAYFVKKDLLNENVKEVTLEQGFVLSKFRESNIDSKQLTYAGGEDRVKIIKGLPVYNVETNSIEPL